LIARLNADLRGGRHPGSAPLAKAHRFLLVLDAIDPTKDVDGFHVVNVGRLAAGLPGLVPCTPLGCLMLLKDRLGDFPASARSCWDDRTLSASRGSASVAGELHGHHRPFPNA
jgi:hypothetical protein